jgi:hypothetical protein
MNRDIQFRMLQQLVDEGQAHLIVEDLAKICELRVIKAIEAGRTYEANHWHNQQTAFEVVAGHLERNQVDHEKTPR